MNLLPKASPSRPRLACEILPGGIVAGRSAGPGEALVAVAKAVLPDRAVVPSLKPGNIPDRVAVVAALRRVLEGVGGRPNARNAEITLIIPDAAVRVLLLDFDALPPKLSEALPIVRFRLKKLVPFDADEAMVSFQIMSNSRAVIRVLAVAIPRDVLGEYETVVREAGFEPGAVLPSTLAALAALDEGEGAALLVNAHPLGITTAIVRAGIILLHRAVELADSPAPTPANLPSALFEPTVAVLSTNCDLLPLVDRHATQAEWAAQQPLPEHGRYPFTAQPATEIEGQAYGGERVSSASGAHTFDMYASEAAPGSRSPYASPALQEELSARFEDAAYLIPAGLDEQRDDGSNKPVLSASRGDEQTITTHTLAPDLASEETARAVSVAIAYFEDTLATPPEILLSAGPLGAESLNRILREQGVAEQDGVRAREVLDTSFLAQAATSAQVPRGWLAGVAGALRS